MKKGILLITLIGLSYGINAQSLAEKQMQNARATGYSIIASRNPNIDFTVIVIPWDGVNTLEQNAISQINPYWHAQAAIKGNYYDQSFDGTDFSMYSTVVFSQERFDQFKNTGTQWWIVCSNLPPFSEKTNFNGNVGIGTTNAANKLDIQSQTRTGTHATGRPFYVTGDVGEYSNGFEFRHSNGSQGVGFGYNSIYATGTNTNQNLNLMPKGNGNVGIGTSNPSFKLDVLGTVRSREVKVDMNGADFVFEQDYKLMPLDKLEQYLQKEKHLPEITSAKEMEINGVDLGNLNSKLLQKIEELTLYMIEINKKSELQDKLIKKLQQLKDN